MMSIIHNALVHPLGTARIAPSILANRKLFSVTRNIEGLLSWKVGLYLYRAVMEINHPSSVVIEVGAYRGLSTIYLAYASKKKGKRVKTFDWFRGLGQLDSEVEAKFDQGYCASDAEAFDENLRLNGLRDVVDLTIGDARKTLFPVLTKNGFSVAFLDLGSSDVTYELLNQLREVIHGKEIIVIHDYNSPGIVKAAGNFMNFYKDRIKSRIIDKNGECPAIELKIL